MQIQTNKMKEIKNYATKQILNKMHADSFLRTIVDMS